MTDPACRLLSDDALEGALLRLVRQERERLVELLTHLGEYDRRQLAVKRGRPSLWRYCTSILGYSEQEAWVRIQAARGLSADPEAGRPLARGEISLHGFAELARHLTADNRESLLAKALGKSVREIEVLVAEFVQRPDIADRVQRLPAPQALPQPAMPLLGGPPIAPRAEPSPSSRPEPLAPQRFHFGFTADAEFKERFERAKAVLWHKLPAAGLEDVFGQALEDLLDRRDPGRIEAVAPTQKRRGTERSRYIPKWVRAEVWRREGGRCAFVAADGARCGEEAGLEYDHVVPFARGGASDDPANLRLLCRAHNQLRGREDFGDYRTK